MSQPSNSPSETQSQLADYLKSRGYSPEEVQKILAKLASYDHKTLSDAVFDSIGNNAQSLDQIIRGVLQGKRSTPVAMGRGRHGSPELE